MRLSSSYTGIFAVSFKAWYHKFVPCVYLQDVDIGDRLVYPSSSSDESAAGLGSHQEQPAGLTWNVQPNVQYKEHGTSPPVAVDGRLHGHVNGGAYTGHAHEVHPQAYAGAYAYPAQCAGESSSSLGCCLYMHGAQNAGYAGYL